MKKLYTNRVQKRIKKLHANTKNDVVLSKFAYRQLVNSKKNSLQRVAKDLGAECRSHGDEFYFNQVKNHFDKYNKDLRREFYKKHNYKHKYEQTYNKQLSEKEPKR